jgi:hypothetical protein
VTKPISLAFVNFFLHKTKADYEHLLKKTEAGIWTEARASALGVAKDTIIDLNLVPLCYMT